MFISLLFFKLNKCVIYSLLCMIYFIIKIINKGTSLAVQWLGLRASNAGGAGSIPGGATKIPQATWHGQNQ